MIKTITEALFRKKAPPNRRFVGEVWKGNLRARVVAVTGELFLEEFWIELDWYDQNDRTSNRIGLLRCEKLESQLAVLRQITDDLATRMAAHGTHV